MQPPWQELEAQYRDKVVMVEAAVMFVNELEPYTAPSQGRASGSGIFVGEEGVVLTNCHVVRDAYSLRVRLSRFGDVTFPAVVTHLSTERDLALLQVTDTPSLCRMLGTTKVPVVQFADSSRITRGQHVLAVGHPLGMRQQVTTQGVINAKQWAPERNGIYLQIQAPINHGSSGGALFVADRFDASDDDDDDDDDPDDYSHHWRLALVGVNSAGIDSANLIGFAIESNEVQTFLRDIRNTKGCMKIVPSSNHLGLRYNNMSHARIAQLGIKDNVGVMVHGLVPDAPLQSATMVDKNGRPIVRNNTQSLQHGDILTSIATGVGGDMLPSDWQEYFVDNKGQVVFKGSDFALPLEVVASNLGYGDYVKLGIVRPKNNAQYDVVAQMLPPNPEYPRLYLPAHDDDVECHAYTVFAGMVVRPLTQNIMNAMAKRDPEAAMRMNMLRSKAQQQQGLLVVTHMHQGCELSEQGVITPGSGVHAVNGKPVRTMQCLYSAVAQSTPNTPISFMLCDGRETFIDADTAIKDTHKLQQLFHFQHTPEIDLLETMARSTDSVNMAAAQIRQQQRQAGQQVRRNGAIVVLR
jgi:S1-C subfamily serine protease